MSLCAISRRFGFVWGHQTLLIDFRGIDFGELLSPEVRAQHKHTAYDLIANIVHDGDPGSGKGSYRSHILHKVMKGSYRSYKYMLHTRSRRETFRCSHQTDDKKRDVYEAVFLCVFASNFKCIIMTGVVGFRAAENGMKCRIYTLSTSCLKCCLSLKLMCR